MERECTGDETCDCDKCLQELGMTREQFEKRMADSRDAVKKLLRKPAA